MSASYRDALVSSGKGKNGDNKEGNKSSDPVDVLPSTTSIATVDPVGSNLSSSPDLDTKEIPLIPSPKPDHFKRDPVKEDESRESPDSSAGSSFKKLPGKYYGLILLYSFDHCPNVQTAMMPVMRMATKMIRQLPQDRTMIMITVTSTTVTKRMMK